MPILTLNTWRGLVVSVPVFLSILAMIGTAAMLWVGGTRQFRY
ncbi:DUF808 family protein [Sinorhizobium sp. RAC02]|nr:DUF808 family protein [Sinorhizobium sp. RAC02]AOF93274.1 putative membrane protein [Sinorhizobium sp. RAC02]